MSALAGAFECVAGATYASITGRDQAGPTVVCAPAPDSRGSPDDTEPLSTTGAPAVTAIAGRGVPPCPATQASTTQRPITQRPDTQLPDTQRPITQRPLTQRPFSLRVVDSPVVDAGVRTLLGAHRDRFRVLPRCADASWSALAAGADLLLCDAELPETALAALLRTGVPVALFSWNHDPDRARRSLWAGARGVLPKSLEPEALMAALDRLAAGELVAPTLPEAAGAHDVSALHRAWGLTPREEEILALLAQGCTNRAIAEQSFVSVNTVKTHLRSLFQKLGVSNRAQAVRWWFDHRHPLPEPGPAPALGGVGAHQAYGGGSAGA